MPTGTTIELEHVHESLDGFAGQSFSHEVRRVYFAIYLINGEIFVHYSLLYPQICDSEMPDLTKALPADHTYGRSGVRSDDHAHLDLEVP